eukprot:TRINITY_DN35953_c0_g1_i2.p1 TRINITY_DN35953_c0_g1~~TRINITY_DN35953_c0_g1_i2.p1  ORF type:complete len:180 (+),score=31.34 TRINITY_DN35953_c0_g1_i2:426-965(+)
MQGIIEVMPSEEMMLRGEELREMAIRLKTGTQSYSGCVSTDIEKSSIVESLFEIDPEVQREESVYKVIEKYLDKTKWELPRGVAQELQKLEKDNPLLESSKEEARKRRNRNRRKREKVKKLIFFDQFKDEPPLTQHLLRLDFKRIMQKRKKILKEESECEMQTHNRRELIQRCMKFSSD